jgi:hypothetical protein
MLVPREEDGVLISCELADRVTPPRLEWTEIGGKTNLLEDQHNFWISFRGSRQQELRGDSTARELTCVTLHRIFRENRELQTQRAQAVL